MSSERCQKVAFFRTFPSLLALFAASALAISCAHTGGESRSSAKSGQGAADQQSQQVRLTVVGTNDLHGWLEPRPRPALEDGTPLVGGFDMFAGYIETLREQRPDEVLLLDAGDMFQGTLVVNVTEGEAVIKAYRALGYDAVALGNHEFDYGPVGEQVVAIHADDDPLGNIKKQIANAGIPILTGNIFDKESGQPVDWEGARRTVMVERAGLKVGIIGLSTPMTPTVTLAQNVESLEFLPLLDSTLELAQELRDEGAQVVILLMHAGGGCAQSVDPHELGSCNHKSELFELLKELPEGTVDAVVAGHTHQFLSHFVYGVPSIQSSSFGEAFGTIELVYDRALGKVDTSQTRIWQPTPVCRQVYQSTGSCLQGQGETIQPRFLGQRIGPSATLAAVIAEDLERVESLKNEKLGPVLKKPFGRSRTKESELGSFVADVMRSAWPKAHVAATNSGGIRTDIGPGELTYGDVFAALPFENRLALLTVSGDELIHFLRLGVAGKHGIFQVSGVELEVLERGAEACRPEDGRLVSARFSDGSPIDPAATYTLVTNDFIAGGGDSMEPVLSRLDPERIDLRSDLPTLREAVVAYFRAHPEVEAPPVVPGKRIRFVTPQCGQ